MIDGVRAGGALGAGVVGLAFVGLAPPMSWVPEVPLLGVAILLPLVTYGLTGYRVAKRTGSAFAATIASAMAGAISGVVGGLGYVVFGKSAVNVVVGLRLGAVGGAIVGAATAGLRRRGRLGLME